MSTADYRAVKVGRLTRVHTAALERYIDQLVEESR